MSHPVSPIVLQAAIALYNDAPVVAQLQARSLKNAELLADFKSLYTASRRIKQQKAEMKMPWTQEDEANFHLAESCLRRSLEATLAYPIAIQMAQAAAEMEENPKPVSDLD